MSNYPNMSYCMFENTRLAMDQIMETLQEAFNEGDIKDFINNLSHSERRAFQELYQICEQFNSISEEIDDAVNAY